MNDDRLKEGAKSPKTRSFLRMLVTLGAAVSLPLALLGLLPFESLATDLPSHFVPQYAMGTGALLALAAWCRPHKSVFAALGFVFLVSLWQLAPYLPAKNAQEKQTTAKPLKILQANVLFINRDASRLQQLLAKEKPDVVIASEVNAAFATMFAKLKKNYPHQQVFAEDDNPRGLAVVSKLPLEGAEQVFFDSRHVPAQKFSLKHNGKTIRFLSIHPFTPVVNLGRRDNEFRLIAAQMEKDGTDNLVILGDFNATPWCNGYHSLVKPLKLANAREGRGIFPTWPSFFPLPLMRIPIDHVLLGRNISVRDFRLGPNIGSDHLPVIAEID